MADNSVPWGTLTGIRPTKVAEKLFTSGETKRSVTDTLIQTYRVSPGRADLCTEAAQTALSFKNSLTPRDVVLYIGIPFCPTRCAYCSFVSNSVERSRNLIEPFIEVLLQEIEEIAGIADEYGLRIISVYIGGGTPTSLPDAALEKVMSALERAFDHSHLREYTIEAGRPDTITESKLKIITGTGTKRICINPQTMSDEVLSAIGRCHSSEDVYNAVKLVRQTGAVLNMDIIAGLPHDTLGSFQKTLDTVVGFKPENITVHTLSLKKGSRLMLEKTDTQSAENRYIIPEAPLEALCENVGEMLDYSSRNLREHGYAPYYIYRQKYISGGFENTGWSRPGHEGVYNICMMEELCTVLALGGGGVTKIVTSGGRIERIFNAKYPLEYITMTEKIKDKVGRLREYAVSI